MSIRTYYPLLLVFVSLFLSISGFSKSNTVYNYIPKSEPELVGEYLYLFVDENGSLTIDDIAESADFVKSESEVPNLDVTPATVWVRLTINNNSSYERLLLEVENTLLNEVTLYEQEDGEFKATTISKDQPFEARGNTNQSYQFELDDVRNTTKTYYISIKSYAQKLIPVKVGTVDSIATSRLNRDVLAGVYFGIMLVMFFYNIFVFFSTRDRSYLYYIIYIFTVTLVQLNITGLGYKYIWPHAPQFEKISVYLFPSLTAFASIAFIREFLHTKQYVPKMHKGFWVFVIAYIITIINAIFGDKYLSYNLLNINALPLALYMIAIAAYIRSKYKLRQALFFLVAWTVFLVSIMLFVMKDFGVLPYNLLTVSFIQIGSAFVVVLLSIALADNINILRKEKEESQEQALFALEENARIVREQNVMLETKVNERTIELSQSNDELNKTLRELKEAESQLVESEKMASLGQLTAGIAHEINNPINFVTSNVKPLKRDFEMMTQMLDQIQEIGLDENTTIEEKKGRINELKEELDYDYLKTEIDYLLKGISEGSNRTAEIVKGLRVFSRLDEDDLKKADINEGLDSTLIIVNNLIGSTIEVKKEYGNLPVVECYPGKLNQVFLNMITNGLQAVKSKFKEENGGVLTISTAHDEENVIVKIKDNGVGMDEKTQKKVFEPFFTTKEVGEGTGLGMSIVYNTINKHNGKIELNSALGEGTEFIITIPINHNVEKIENVG